MTTVGIVVIGRNEGQRLTACLHSLADTLASVVYVDSGSSDGSVEVAERLGAHVIALDRSEPFTAARARNVGIRWQCGRPDPPEFVQVVDGDCVVDPDWIARASLELTSDPTLGIVCGRRREKYPDSSVYNRLCDMEWNTPVGPATACGGDAMMRTAAFEAAGGYDPTLIAGEDPEFAHRVRKCGFGILRVDAEMTLHDADMTRFGQWWLRSSRSGHAFAECERMHRRDGTAFRRRQVLSIVLWGGAIPAAILAFALRFGPVALLLALIYPAQWLRIVIGRRRHGGGMGDDLVYATSCMVGKFSQLQGVGQYYLNRAFRRSTKIIEYKSTTASPTPTDERR